jgi:hypothetical protein
VNILDPLATERCFEATRKGGTLVLTGMADEFTDVNVQLSGGILSMYAKRVLGTVYGGCNPHDDIPRLLDLYRSGHLKLAELISRRYPCAQLRRAMTTSPRASSSAVWSTSRYEPVPGCDSAGAAVLVRAGWLAKGASTWTSACRTRAR